MTVNELKYYPFSTNGANGSFVIPDEVHEKIGKILHDWLANNGNAVSKNTMTIHVMGECMVSAK